MTLPRDATAPQPGTQSAGDLAMAQSNFADAAAYYAAEAASLSTDDNELRAEILNKLGTAYYHDGDFAAAEGAYIQCIEAVVSVVGVAHADVAVALNNLALACSGLGKFEDAERIYRRVLAIERNIHGPNDPTIAVSLNNLGLLYKKMSRLDAAEDCLKRSLAIKKRNFGPKHPSLEKGLLNYTAIIGERADAPDAP